jgi:hypothetical protein
MVLSIEFDNTFTLKFSVLDTPVAQLWLDRMALRDQYPLDHPDRFYGFNSYQDEVNRALLMINDCIDVINAHDPIVSKSLNTITDQDTLNYLHSIFEQYHGLLDQQNSEYWISAPDSIRTALADLNLAVHRCETAQSTPTPRLVCTWYGQPKQHTLPLTVQQQYGTVNPLWGSVCLNYCEIGKTLEDLARDNDRYIGDDAFRPFSYYSSDFVVRFFEYDTPALDKTHASMQQYYSTHREFFHNRGFESFDNTQLQPLRFPVAQLIETMPRDQLLQEIAARQQVTNIHIQ